MATWSRFAAEQPEFAEAGRQLLYQYGPGLGYLATVRADGAPRVHPICPFLSGDDLVMFIVTGTPKYVDLIRDGRVAIHTFSPEDVDDEFHITGVAQMVRDEAVRAAAVGDYHLEHVPDDHALFRIDLRSAMHAKYRFRGEWPPSYRVWKSA